MHITTNSCYLLLDHFVYSLLLDLITLLSEENIYCNLLDRCTSLIHHRMASLLEPPAVSSSTAAVYRPLILPLQNPPSLGIQTSHFNQHWVKGRMVTSTINSQGGLFGVLQMMTVMETEDSDSSSIRKHFSKQFFHHGWIFQKAFFPYISPAHDYVKHW